mgnify:CR=1 FL=1
MNRIEKMERRRVDYKRDLHAGVGCAILRCGGEARYGEIRRETGIRDKQLSKTLKEMKSEHKITSRVDNSQRPPAVYYRLTKKGYEDKRLQREWFAEVEMPSVIESALGEPAGGDYESWRKQYPESKRLYGDDLEVARKILRLTFLTVSFTVEILAEDYVKRIVSNEIPVLEKDGEETPIMFQDLLKNPRIKDLLNRHGIAVKWPCGHAVDFTDYTDIEDVLVPGLVDALAVVIDRYLTGVRWIRDERTDEDWKYRTQKECGFTDEKMKKIAAQKFRILSQAIAETLKGEDEVEIMEEFRSWWHGEKKDFGEDFKTFSEIGVRRKD